MSTVKLNISLESRVAKALRQHSREASIPASRYISELIIEDIRRRQDALAEEGYRLLDNGENRELEDKAWKIAAEGWPDWNESESDANA